MANIVPHLIREIINEIFKYNIVDIRHLDGINHRQKICVTIQGDFSKEQLNQMMNHRMNVLEIHSRRGEENQDLTVDYLRVKKKDATN